MATTQEEIQTKRNLAELTTSIRNKFMKLRQAESKFEKEQERFFKPILKTKEQGDNTSEFPVIMSEAEIDNMLNEADDKQFGIVKRGKLWYLGELIIDIKPKGIRLGNKIFRCSPGLISLLTRKQPEGNTPDDDADFATALRMTGVHLNRFGILKDVHSYKCQNIIRPLFEISSANRGGYANSSAMALSSPDDSSLFTIGSDGGASTDRPFQHTPLTMRTRAGAARKLNLQSGEGLLGITKKVIKPCTRNPQSQLVYWNNVNELVERLYLLRLAKQAGNTSVTNEIANIEAELREANIIR